ncbi:TPA: hypothetical protein EYP70_01800 [Candidatus Bathyarchaeota archaeon]|nr:hypothetical protein [Candidatus Bathyarchaeota archaeon]
MIFLVLIPIAYTWVLGWWTPMPTGIWGYICYRLYGQSSPAGGTPNIGWIIFGGILTLAVFPIIRNLSTMGPIFGALVGKEPSEDVDPERPLPYKIAWWGLIASIILYVALATVAEVIPIWSLMWLLLITLMLFGSYRLVAETGGYLGYGFGHPFHFASWPQQITGILLAYLNPVVPIVGIEPTRATVMTHAFTSYGLGHGILAGSAYGAGYITLESFKLGKLSNISLRDVMIAVVIALAICLFTHGFGTFLWTLIFPIDKYLGALFAWIPGLFFKIYVSNIAVGVPYWADKARYLNLTQVPGPIDAIIKLIIGVAIVVSLSLARERFPWLRISPAGLILGAAFGMKFWAPFIAALMIKYITLKVGGVRLYDEKIKPIMIGFLYGFGLAFMIHLLIFVPGFIKYHYG